MESTKIANAPEPLLHAKQPNANELELLKRPEESLNKKELLKLLVKLPQPLKLEDLLKLELNKML